MKRTSQCVTVIERAVGVLGSCQLSRTVCTDVDADVFITATPVAPVARPVAQYCYIQVLGGLMPAHVASGSARW